MNAEEDIDIIENQANIIQPDLPRRFTGTVSFEDNELSEQLFFGRELEAKKLLHLILAENLVVLFAKSGYGKTSLLQAKIFRQLREKGFYPILIRFNKKELTPAQSIRNSIFSINNSLDFEASIPEQDTRPNSLIFLEKTEIWSSEDKLLIPVIIFDQFEEIFTLEHNLKYQRKLFEEISSILKLKKEGKN